MAQEITDFLWTKFSDGLGDEKVPLHSSFLELKNLLELKRSPTLAPDESKALREILYYLNNVLAECQMLSSTHKVVSFEGQLFLYKARTSLNKKIKDLQGGNSLTMVAASNHGASSHPNGVASFPENENENKNENENENENENGEYFRWSSRSVPSSKVHGLDDGVISVERMLKINSRGSEDRFKAIGIVGTSGVGKTTLAQLIFNKKEVKDYFLPRIWVCMSKQSNEKEEDANVEIVKRMLMCLGVEDNVIKSVSDKHKLKGLLYALQLQLKGKRYLIVLDDAWNTDNWYEEICSSQDDKELDKQLAYGFPKGNGGTIVVTSRYEEVAEKMVGKDNMYRLLPLSNEENCWSIFKGEALKGGDEVNLENLKKEVKQKCAGLPLAAKAMGQTMYQEIQKSAKLNRTQSA